ncbi:hypothetical protein IE53DRAFT_56577 [Violaceomyces palustris]|uniref:Uncharacterized protein n=1 Tax=Violaceomyces palustris TaxID=1673888 RepID=A0ACD0NZP5_9BASI|nr:hypothetical protein IE53DRAFT_56577 [Violaceomyces palustris]
MSDLAQASLLSVATYYALRGSIAPNKAPPEERYKKDFISRIRMTTIAPRIFSTIYLGSTALQIWSLPWSTAKPLLAPISKEAAGNALGCLLTIAGGWLRVRCYKELGRYFTFDLAITKNQKIVDTGPYAILRHPSYTAFLLVQTGIVLTHVIFNLAPKERRSMLFQSMRLLLAAFSAFVCPIMITKRVREEEEMLLAHFGEQYKDYCKRTKRLIPYIY